MTDDISKLREILQKVDFFYSLSYSELDELIKTLKKRIVPAGQTIIRQGEKGDAFFMIVSGSVSVSVKKGMVGQKKVAELGAGDFFGETALVTEEPRNATITADERCELFVLYKKDFKKILLANPKISTIINKVLAERKAQNKGN
jgi:CPA1 family monovalent cation:H+ antiporter